jgi:sortase A
MLSLVFFERLLWATAAVCIACCLIFGAQSHAYRTLAQQIDHPQPALVAFAIEPVIGRIDVPALALTAPIASDIDPGSLRSGVGHIHGTALPGGLGTVGLAGHRDSFFRPLRRIKPGMDIHLTSTAGTFHYLVDSTEIVTPDHVHVLDIVQRPELTLITCFPFDFIGAAPKRFIVHAHLLSAAPDRRNLSIH